MRIAILIFLWYLVLLKEAIFNENYFRRTLCPVQQLHPRPISKGEKVWGFETLKSDVLYLCLEDSFTRIQSRLFEITDEAPPTLHFAIMSDYAL